MRAGLVRGWILRLARRKRLRTPAGGLSYWHERARRFGARAVLNIGHPAEHFDEVTSRQKALLLPRLQHRLEGWEKIVLDLGCGPGRFTPDLARIVEGEAIGVDPIPSLLELAPQASGVRYERMDVAAIPLPAEHVDVAWICLVLGGITDSSTLDQTIREVDRVLRPRGLVFLVENTTESPNPRGSAYWHFRSVSEYRSLLYFAPLEHLGDYLDQGEQISIMAGRKAAND